MKAFALDVFCFCANLSEAAKIGHVRDQLQRSSTSVASNYRAACRAKSRADFVAKLGIVEEEADESAFWLEFIETLNQRLNLNFEPSKSCELARLHHEAL
jgi:four helix bundle protein